MLSATVLDVDAVWVIVYLQCMVEMMCECWSDYDLSIRLLELDEIERHEMRCWHLHFFDGRLRILWESFVFHDVNG